MIKYSIIRSLQKLNNKIIETVKIHPEIRIFSDEFRSIKYKNQALISLISASEFFELSDILHISDYLRISEFKIKEDIDYSFLEPLKEIKFKYQPRLGKKKCSFCYFKYKNLCFLKGKKLKGDYWHKCQYYLENSKIEKE